jgi:bifunctional non-homologous end joining protein LigD
MPTERTLGEYNAKRDFAGGTPEPAGRSEGKRGSAASKPKSAGRTGETTRGFRFVVQEHHARSLHWDLRLERDGVLVSWAVPKGIPDDPRRNRLAVHVEDHPLDYIDFAGEIPAGSYGAGEVQIWDAGTYECHKFRDDEVIVTFHGARVRGKYALFQTKGKNWMIHRMDPPLEDERERMPEQIVPMPARAGRLPANDAEWAFEIKWDGVRAITYWRPGELRIESRNLNDVSSRYPELRALGPQLGSREAVLDGEIVAFDEEGRPSFERLQRRMHIASPSAIRRLAEEEPVSYMIFDLLHLDGHTTMELPYRERRALLEGLELRGPAWQTPAYHAGEGRELLAAAAEQLLEGVVAKRLDSPYRPGRRTDEWLKIKHVNRQELVIGGWLPGKGARSGQLGALLVGYYEPGAGDGQDGRNARTGKDSKDERRHGSKPLPLRYAGRVGTGFDEQELERLGRELAARAQESSPFSGTQPPREARFVEPGLVAEIEFRQWTHDRILRHSVYKGLREDKPADEVRLEAPIPARDEQGGETQGKTAEERGTRGRSTRGSREHRPPEQPYEVVHATKRAVEIEIEGRTLKLTNREKLMYPRSGFTKGELIDYYAAVAPVLLPHLAGRPLTLKRYPDGVEGEYFYEKRCPPHRPDWVRTAAIASERGRGTIDYCLAEDLPTLVWAANLADIELHTSLSRAERMDRPTAIVFDLDPGAPAALRQCCRVALWIREIFDSLGLHTFVKTSGAKGLQVYAPLNTPVGYEQTKSFALAVAELLQKRHPRQVVARMAKELRPGRVLVDWSQNDEHKTTVCVYSLRARERPTISTPLAWEEVESALGGRRGEPSLSAEPRELLERVERDGDLFAPLLTLAQELPDLAGSTRAAEEFGSPPAAGRTSAKAAARAPKANAAKKKKKNAGAEKNAGTKKQPSRGGAAMPPRGVQKGSKRERQYKHIVQSEREQGASTKRAEEIAARTVNKERARSGESQTLSRSSTEDISSGRRGGLRSGRPGPRGRTREQLYQEARKLKIDGRSAMNKEQLRRAVDARK